MIVTVTLNPTLDKMLRLQRLEPGAFHRAEVVRQDLGGKGINVSRALLALGVSSALTGFFGGRTGQIMRTGLEEAGMDVRFIDVPGETRQKLTLFDESRDEYTEINEPGPVIPPAKLAEMEKLVQELASPGDLWAFCGSLPPGAPDDTYARLIHVVHARGAKALLDTSGPSLESGIEAPPFGVKPNSEEAAALVGKRLVTDEEYLIAARDLQSRGIPLVMLSRGAKGVVLLHDGAAVVAVPPAVPARSPVGAGDSAVAGLLWGLLEGMDTVGLAARAVACGSAAAMQEGTGVGDLALVESLLSQVTVTVME
jgi:1-phosphofructokinase family hexose kinase